MKKFRTSLRLALTVCLLVTSFSLLNSYGLAESKKIVFATFPGQEQAMKDIADAFKKKTGIEVVTHILPRTGYREALIGPLSAGSGEFDAIYIQNPWLAEFAEAGFLDPIDKYLSSSELKAVKADQFPGAYNVGVYKGKLWGLPWDLSTFLFFYRTDLIKEAPKTMDEYLEMAKKFTKSISPTSPTNYGTVLEGSPERVNYQEWYSFLWAFGGDLFDRNGKPTLNSKAAIEALKFRYEMKTKYGVVPPDVDSYRFPEVLTAFQEGVAPMIIQWNSAFATFADEQKSPKIYNKFAATMIPSYKTKSGKLVSKPFAKAWYLTLNKYSKNKKEATQWITYFTGVEASRIAIKDGATPGSVKVWSEPETLKLRKDAEVFMKTFKIAKMTPNLPELPAIEDKLGQALTFVLSNKKTPEQALNDVNQEAITILKQSGRLK
jgi:multiple sugar transport system substrate-binding protein